MLKNPQTIGCAHSLGVSLRLIGMLGLMLVTAAPAQEKAQQLKDGAKVVITTRHGDQIAGTLLFASDSALVLYNLRPPQAPATIVPASEIERIKIVITGGFDEHIVIAANVAAYEAYLPKLRMIAAYRKLPPPELYALMQSSTQPTASASSAISTTGKPDSTSPPSVTMALPAKTKRPAFRLPAAKLHLSITTGPSSRVHKDDMLDAFKSSGFGGYREDDTLFTTYPYTGYSDYSGWSLSAEYNLSRHACLGLAMHKMPDLEVEGKDYEFEQVGGTSYSLFVRYVPRPAAPLFLSRWEFAGKAGLSYSAVTVKGSLIPFTFYDFPISRSNPTFAIKKNVVGVYWQESLDYYITKRLSLQYKFFSGRFMQAVQVPEISERTVGGVTKTLKPHALHLTTFEGTFGVRLHF